MEEALLLYLPPNFPRTCMRCNRAEAPISSLLEGMIGGGKGRKRRRRGESKSTIKLALLGIREGWYVVRSATKEEGLCSKINGVMGISSRLVG